MELLDSVFFALADPTRRAIVARLARGEATVTELAKPFAISQPAVSQHLKVLEEAGLISRRVDGTKRPCLLREEGMRTVEAWVAEQRSIWEDRLDRMENYVNQLKKGQGNAKRKRRR
ncbi:MAG: winged helix-turn-helix transcriptional regulator [Alphaproteobacteria bacterium]|nr:winged helix-turn-helix transcriptional regulator [Alphaproteobacteria bacterium]